VNPKVHVAVGVVKNNNGEYLISKRHEHLHQGNLWEFPGGKVEKNETSYAALCRELYEELKISVLQAEPLVKISHQYSDKHVLLDVWLVDSYEGIPVSQQQQPVQWVQQNKFDSYSFPQANKLIISCLQLSPYYAITGSYNNLQDFSSRFEHSLKSGAKLIQLRSKNATGNELSELLSISKSLCDIYNTKLLVNSSSTIVNEVDGIHLDSKKLMSLSERPISYNKLLAASVHNKVELTKAMEIEVDFIVVSPVLETTSHPGARILNWAGLKQLVELSTIPVYALGGMQKSMIPQIKETGAFGLAAISEFWSL